jgi:hypothetical protein
LSADASLSSSTTDEGPCDRLFDRFGADPGFMDQIKGAAGVPVASISFEASATGPFVFQALSPAAAGELQTVRDAITACARFPSGDLTVTVNSAPFPRCGDESVALALNAATGPGDDSETLGGYLVAARVKDTVCTVVNYGVPGVDVSDTETIVRKAVGKL